MYTEIKKVDIKNIDQNIIDEASKMLKEGKLVAFPTETVYGLGADGLNKEASEKIYKAKGRPSDNPLIVHIAKREQLKDLVSEIPEYAEKLMDAYWPGPLTIIFKKSTNVPYETTGGLDSVAIRMPNHPIAYKLLEDSMVPVAAPSANTSGRPSPTNAFHVKQDLEGKIDMIIDGGDVGIGIESTIVDVTTGIPTILRPGYITKEMIKKTLGIVEVDKAIIGKPDISLIPKAPGMKYKHYAPKGDLTLVEGNIERVIKKINSLVDEKIKQGYKVGVMCTDETFKNYNCPCVKTLGKRNDSLSVSHNLYRVLREFDEDKIDYMYGEAFTDKDFGQAVMNRLNKASGYKKIEV